MTILVTLSGWFLFVIMSHLNIEIKARTDNPDFVRAYLTTNHADFRGVDHQTDTYYNIENGRLKLREGNIENNLIYYEREDLAGARESKFNLIDVSQSPGLKELLKQALGVLITVSKKREIYFIGNVKFHIDEVPDLGSFVEIEASNIRRSLSKEELENQCNFFIQELKIKNHDLVPASYSDMLLALAK